jgi:hypothetical protein
MVPRLSNETSRQEWATYADIIDRALMDADGVRQHGADS